jgi:hypothetical protein
MNSLLIFVKKSKERIRGLTGLFIVQRTGIVRNRPPQKRNRELTLFVFRQRLECLQ